MNNILSFKLFESFERGKYYNIIITPELEKYVKKYYWHKNMLQLIGKTLRGEYVVKSSIGGLSGYYGGIGEEYGPVFMTSQGYIPASCVIVDDGSKFHKPRKIEKRDIDPYDEEDWGWEWVKEGKDEPLPFYEGDRVIVTKKKSKYYNQTGIITYLDYVDSSNPMSSSAEVTLDYTISGCSKTVPIRLWDLEKIDSVRKITLEDPYGEEDWNDTYESKVNEIFDTEKTYPYEFYKKRSWMKPFVDHIYRFKSKDDVTYYVTVSYNSDLGRASVKFTDEANYTGIMNKVKDKYVNLENFDAINVLNTVFKICKDYYVKNSDKIKEVTTNTLDPKRLNIYKYLFGKYFPKWKMSSYKDNHGEFVIECRPIKK